MSDGAAAEPTPVKSQVAPEPPAAAAAAVVDVETIRRVWPDVVERLAGMRRVTWMMVRDHATVASFDGRRLVLALGNPGVLTSFQSGAHGEFVQQALIDVLGVDARVEVVRADTMGGDAPMAGPADPPGGPGITSGRGASRGGDASSAGARDDSSAGDGSDPGGESSSAPAVAWGEPDGWGAPQPERAQDGPTGQGAAADRSGERPGGADAAASSPATGGDGPSARRELPSRSADGPSVVPSRGSPDAGVERSAAGVTSRPAPTREPPVDVADDEPSVDDVDAADSGLVGRSVVEQMLGGRVIDETDA